MLCPSLTDRHRECRWQARSLSSTRPLPSSCAESTPIHLTSGVAGLHTAEAESLQVGYGGSEPPGSDAPYTQGQAGMINVPVRINPAYNKREGWYSKRLEKWLPTWVREEVAETVGTTNFAMLAAELSGVSLQ